MISFTNIFGIVSAEKFNLTQQENKIRTEQAAWVLRQNGYQVTECEGNYNGIKETSLLVELPCTNPNGWPMYDILKSVAETYQQESFIFCPGNNEGAGLVKTDKQGTLISWFTHIETEVDKSYTKLPNGFKFELV